MAKRETLITMIDRLEPTVRRAFLESINRITSDVQLSLLEDAIAKRDMPRVFRLLNLRSEYFEPLDRALTAAYQGAGDAVMAGLMDEAARAGYRITGQFSSRNLRAEGWLRRQSSQLITEITEDQRDTVRVLMEAATRQGSAPRSTALDLVGRINRKTGVREGGAIGLRSDQVARGERVREILTTNPRDYFIKDRATGEWKPRYKGTDRRFDRKVAKAIREDRTLSKVDAEKVVRKYRATMLRQRGETIARTELLGSVHAAQEEGLSQLVDDSKVDRENIMTEWDSSEDSDTRDSHRAADGQKRQKGEPFDVGGYQMLHPGDRSLGAPAEEIINCRCYRRTRIDWIAQAAQEDEVV